MKKLTVLLIVGVIPMVGMAADTVKSVATAGAIKGCPPYADGGKFDASPIVDAIDTNHDNKMTHEEWQKAGAPEGSWQRFMSYPSVKAQGYVSRTDFVNETPPNGVDANCDKKITLEEFLAFSKTMDAGMGAGGPPGDGQGGPRAKDSR